MNTMNKKFLIYVVCIILIVTCQASIYAADYTTSSTAATAIVPGMDFIGTPVVLTLAEAVKQVTTAGPGYESAVLKRDTFEKQSLEQEELWSQWRSISNTLTAAGPLVPVDVTNPMKSLNARIVRISRPYLLTQAAIQYQMDINLLAYETTQSYYRVVQAEEGLKLAEDNLQNRRNILTNTNKKFELGVVSKMDVLTAESAVTEAEVQLSSADVALKSLKMSFNQKCNYPLMQRVTLTDKLTKNTQSSIYLVGCIESALEKRNELTQLQYVLNVAQLTIDDKIMVSHYSAEYMSALLDLRQAEKNLRDAKMLIEMDIRAKYLGIINAQKEIVALEKTVTNATEGYRLAALSYDAGMNTLVDVHSAQLASYQAQLGLSNKILEYNLALSDLSMAIGYGKPSSGN